MAQLTFSVRMDDNLKKQFDSLCYDLSMIANELHNMLKDIFVGVEHGEWSVSR